MDCRKPLALALGLMGCVAGCHSLDGPQTSTVNKKAEDVVVQKPSTFVAFGDFRAKAGFSPDNDAASQRQYREEARLSYQKALEIDPKYLPAHAALGRLYVAMEDPGHAVAAYQKAVKLNDRDPALWFELGMCHGRQNEWALAVAATKKACERDPDNRLYANTLGFALARAGRHDESFEVMARANGPAKAHYNLARVLCYSNEPEKARQQLMLALQKDPELATARTMLAAIDGRTPAAEGSVIATVGHVEPAPMRAPGAFVPPQSPAMPMQPSN